MKKLLLLIAAVITFATSSVSYAMVKENQAYINGICQEMTVQQVEETLGKGYTRTNLAKNRYSLLYPGGFYVEITGNIVTYIENDRNNGVTTRDGLHVGSTMAEVEDALGRADFEEGNFHIYRASGKKDIAFVYTNDKKVATIYSGMSYEDEENIRKEDLKKSRAKNKIDIGDEIVIRTRQMREAYWNLKSVFNHGKGHRR